MMLTLGGVRFPFQEVVARTFFTLKSSRHSIIANANRAGTIPVMGVSTLNWESHLFSQFFDGSSTGHIFIGF